MDEIAKQHDVACPDCGAPMRLRESKHGLFYGCTRYPECKGTHGAHPNGAPLGIPADKHTKDMRIKAHDAFDQLWKPLSAPYTRAEAYLVMQSLMGMSSDEAHIGKFTASQCQELIDRLATHHTAKEITMDKKIDVKLTPCESSQIESFGYCPDSKTLAVKFKSGGLYHYANVPADVHEQMKAAESVGSFLHKNVKGKFEFARQLARAK